MVHLVPLYRLNGIRDNVYLDIAGYPGYRLRASFVAPIAQGSGGWQAG